MLDLSYHCTYRVSHFRITQSAEFHFCIQFAGHMRQNSEKKKEVDHDLGTEGCLDELKKMKTKKALGPDGTTGEMLKHLGACSRAVLLKIFNQSWIKGVVPAIWKEAIIIPVPKKGKDKKNPHSYCPISLLSCVGKLLERMISR